MFHLQDVLQPKEGEQVEAIIRRHVATLVPPLCLSLLLIVIPFFLLFPLFAWNFFGIILFFASVIFGILVALRSLMLWDGDVLVLTSLRLIDVDRRGVFARSVSETHLGAIQDVSWSRHGMLESLFRSGSVSVQTAGTTPRIEVTRIPRPEAVFELINELRHGTLPVSSVATKAPLDDREVRIERITQLIQAYPLEELVRIEAVLEARSRSQTADAFLGASKASQSSSE
jgi:hypothetical protein